ncbi:Sensor histidine kinase BtsS [Sporomusa aerivorans]
MYLGLLGDVIKNIAVLGVAAYLTTQLPPFRRALSQSQYRLRDKLVLICIFGLFSGIGNYLSIPVMGALANTRIVGAVAGGLLGGPIVGLGAGILGAIPRYFLGGYTVLPSIAANIIVGYLSGLVYNRYGVRNIGVKVALIVSFGAEVILKVLILTFSSSLEAAWELERVIAIPTTFANCLGVMLFVYIVRDVYQEQEKVQAESAQQAMRVIQKTNGIFWNGLNTVSAQKAAKTIYAEIAADAVAVTDTDTVLAFIGYGDDHHIVGQPIITQATKRAIQSRQTVITNDKAGIGCPVPSCPLTAVIDAPLIVDNRFAGSIKVYKTGTGIILPYEAELVQGIADFLSLQLLHGELEAKTLLLAQAEYNSLRAQIHPHFIFNILGTIRATIRTDPKQARALIKDLSVIIRRHIRPGKEMNSIREEFEFIDKYIFLEQARFGERIRIIKVVDPVVYEQEVPVFSVQVLVENAVKHGLSPKIEGGIIEIHVLRDDSILQIMVKDNGVGIASDKIDLLLDPQSDAGLTGGVGIGLNNVHARIQRLFGNEFGIRIESSPARGTCVSIRLPWREEIQSDTTEGCQNYSC